MEVIPRLYAHSKYTHYLPAVVYGSYTTAVVTPQFAQWADSGLRCIILQAVPLILASSPERAWGRGYFDLYSGHSTIFLYI